MTARRPRVIAFRCSGCGVKMPSSACTCLDLAWTDIEWTDVMERAFIYVAKMMAAADWTDSPYEQNRIILNTDMALWTGVTRADLALASLYWRVWGCEDLPERRFPASPTGSGGRVINLSGLYGARP